MGKTTKIPLVSVLTTVYNREKYVASAIESILASTFTDYEMILVDDQSKDSSVEIIREYEKKDPRIKLHINEKNLGDYPNRKKAASLATGRYIKYLDADDLLYPTGLEVLITMMENFPDAGYGLASQEQDKFRIYPFELSPEETYYRHYFEQPVFHKSPLSAIMKKEVFEEVGGFTGKRYIGDFELWHILSAKYPLVMMPHGVAWYREHEDQEMQHNRTDFMVPFKYLKCSEEQLSRTDCPLKEKDRKLALDKVHWNEARYILGVGKNHSLKIMRQLKKETDFSYMKLFKLASHKPY